MDNLNSNLTMQVKSIAFTNFKALKNSSTNFEKNISLIIGKNGSGKTTVMEGIYRTLKTVGIKNSEDKKTKYYLNKSQNIGEGDVTLSLKVNMDDLEDIYSHSPLLKNMNHMAILDDNVIIRWHFTNTGYQDYSIKPEKLSPNEDLEELLNYFEKITYRVNLINSNRKILASEHKIVDENLSNEEYKDYIRNQIYNLSNNNFKKLSGMLRQLFPQYVLLNPIIEKDEINLKIKSFADRFDPVFDINEMSDGFKQILYMLTRILYSKDKILLIDEPDISLHAELLRKFIREVRKLDRQIILSSHNENLLNSFSEDVIRYVSVETNLSSIITPLSLGNRTRLLNDLGCDLSNFNKSRLIGSKLIIFIEDRSKEEHNIIKLLKNADIDIDALKISFETTGGGGLISYDIIDKINGSPLHFILMRDRDEHTFAFVQEATNKLGDRIHFWSRRELENYWIDDNSILTLIRKKTQKKGIEVKEKVKSLSRVEIQSKIVDLSGQFKNSIKYNSIIKKYRIIELMRYSDIGNYIKNHKSDFLNSYVQMVDNKKQELVGYYLEVENKLENNWTYPEVVKNCPGKKLLSKINKWLNTEFGITVSDDELLTNIITPDKDIVELIEKIRKLLPREDLVGITEDPILSLIETKTSSMSQNRQISIS